MMRVRSTKFTRRLGAANRLRMQVDLSQRQIDEQNTTIKQLRSALGAASGKHGAKLRELRAQYDAKLDRQYDKTKEAQDMAAKSLAAFNSLHTRHTHTIRTLCTAPPSAKTTSSRDFLAQWGLWFGNETKVEVIPTPGHVAATLRALLVNITLKPNAGRQTN